jgi:hypothetical protein
MAPLVRHVGVMASYFDGNDDRDDQEIKTGKSAVLTSFTVEIAF